MDKSEILSVEEDAAVAVFREAKGRGWKTALRLNWERSHYPGFSVDVSATLQSLRNTKGPDWLAKYSPEKDAEMRQELALVNPVIAEFTAVAIQLGVPIEKGESAGRQMFGSMAKAFEKIAKESDRDLKRCGLPISPRSKPEIAVVEMLNSRSPEMRLGSITNNCRPYVALYQDLDLGDVPGMEMGNQLNSGWPAIFADGVVCLNQKELDQYLIGTNHQPIEHGHKLSREISFAIGALPREQLEDAAADLDVVFDKWTSSDDLRAHVIEAAHQNGGLVIYDKEGGPVLLGFEDSIPTLDTSGAAPSLPSISVVEVMAQKADRSGSEFRAMTLKQAGRHLLRIVKGNPGPQDHVRVADLCLSALSIDEVEREAKLNLEFESDVDDALSTIQRCVGGYQPLSIEEAREIDAENLNLLHPKAIAVVREGQYSGMVLDVSPEGVVTQKVNRDGLSVRHALSSLSHPVAKGEVVDIKYEGGIGVVGGKDTQALGTGR